MNADYAQRDQWVEKMVSNCEEALHRRFECLRFAFSFYHHEGGRKKKIGDPTPSYDSDELGNCTVTRMSRQGGRNAYVPAGTTISIEVVCEKEDEGQQESASEPPPEPGNR